MAEFPRLTEAARVARLEPPAGTIRVVIDTDTFNEIDDQFAIAYALMSPSRMNVEAIYAAPFHNARSSGPEQGMSLSYDEILRLLTLMHRKPDGFVFRGSTQFIGASGQPQDNAAVRDLIDRAMASTPDDPLYVIALAAITNVASAILLEPRIIERMVLVWLGGHALWWPDTREFNLRQDVEAARVIFDCGVPLVMLPCMGVVSNLRTTVAELEAYVEPCNPLGAFLTHRVKDYGEEEHALGWSKPIWDMAPVAWLNDSSWTADGLLPSPILNADVTWSTNASRHMIRYIHHVNRDAIFGDFFAKLAAFER